MLERELPTIAILCGGLATRLRPLTTSVPKSMLMVGGEPFIAHQLRLLVKAGFRRVVLLCGHLGEQVEDYVRDGRKFSCDVSYSYDGPELLGTGGAVRRAIPLLGTEFVLIYGDSYCPTDYGRIYEGFKRSRKPGLMTVFHNANRWDVSNVEFKQGTIIQYDKKSQDNRLTYIDYGVSIFQTEIFAGRNPNTCFDLSLLQKEMVAEGKLAGLEVDERFYEIGSLPGIAELEERLLGIDRG